MYLYSEPFQTNPILTLFSILAKKEIVLSNISEATHVQKIMQNGLWRYINVFPSFLSVEQHAPKLAYNYFLVNSFKNFHFLDQKFVKVHFSDSQLKLSKKLKTFKLPIFIITLTLPK